jgi:hypothetical protein
MTSKLAVRPAGALDARGRRVATSRSLALAPLPTSDAGTEMLRLLRMIVFLAVPELQAHARDVREVVDNVTVTPVGRQATMASVMPSEAPGFERVARRVAREELLRVLARVFDSPTQDYSSRRGHGPPGYSPRVWRELARAIGTKRGRWHVVTRAQLDAYEAKRGGLAPTSSARAANDTAARPAWTARGALEAAGLHRSR